MARSYKLIQPKLALILMISIAGLIFVWATIVPPFQSPDEIAHFYRAQSIVEQPWVVNAETVKVPKRFENPLVFGAGLSKLPFRADYQLQSDEVVSLRAYSWPEDRLDNPQATVEYHSTAAAYPPVYYFLVFSVAEIFIFLFKTQPYESFYLYRYASCLLSLLFWFAAYRRIAPLFSESSPNFNVLALVALIPTNLFICSTVNVDSIFVPLSVLLFIELFRAVSLSQPMSGLISAVLAGVLILTKPAAIFVLIAFGISFALLVMLKGYWKSGLLVALCCGMSAAGAYFSFYPLIEYKFLGLGSPVSTYEYLQGLWSRALPLCKQFWGAFGWLDYYLSDLGYLIIYVVLFLNFLAFIFARYKHSLSFEWTSFISLLSLATSLAAMECYLVKNSSIGIMLQGRYLFPALLGLSLFFAHRLIFLKYLFACVLIAANIQGLTSSVMRYYAGDYSKLAAALPFSVDSLTRLSARKHRNWNIIFNKGSKWDLSGSSLGRVEFVKIENQKLKIGGWLNIEDSSELTNIAIESPVTPLAISSFRIERTDIQRHLGPTYGQSGFLIELEFSSVEKARIAQKNMCLGVGQSSSIQGVLASNKFASCRSLWRPAL